MKKLIFITFLIIVSCNQNKKTSVIKADLSFKLISWGSFYQAQPEQIEKVEKMFDSIRKNPNSKKQDKILVDFFSRLKKNGLYQSPYISLKINSDSILVVYLTEPEYKKVKDFKWYDLKRRNKKVEIEIEIEKKDFDMYYSKRIINLKEVEGKTYVKK